MKIEITHNAQLQFPEFCDIINQLNLGEGMFVAGGAVRDTVLGIPFNDIDIYYEDWNLCDKHRQYLESNDKFVEEEDKSFLKEYCLDISDETHNRGYLIQSINFRYGSIKEIFDTFDLVHCMFAMDRHFNLYHHENAYQYLLDKQLVFNRSEKATRHPFYSFKRIIKFISRGMTISDDELKFVISRFSEEDLDSLENYSV